MRCWIRPCTSYIPLPLSQLIRFKLILSYQLLGFASGHFSASFFNKILYSFYFPHPYFCVLLCIVHFVSFCVLSVCKYVLYYCHRVATQLQLTNISNIKPRITFIHPNSTRWDLHFSELLHTAYGGNNYQHILSNKPEERRPQHTLQVKPEILHEN